MPDSLTDDPVSLPWQKGLPPFNKLVVAWLEGAQEHSGVSWKRTGFAFMVRHNEPSHTVADEWSRESYEKALKGMGADYASVVSWLPLEEPKHVQ